MPMIGLGIGVASWRNVGLSGGGEPKFLLDELADLGVQAAGAFSTRKLRAAYAGPCMRVRRPTDDAALDIGFTSSGDFDIAAARAFAGIDPLFVTNWFSQVGPAGASIAQGSSNAQPILVLPDEAGAEVRPYFFTDGVSFLFGQISGLGGAQEATQAVVARALAPAVYLTGSNGSMLDIRVQSAVRLSCFFAQFSSVAAPDDDTQSPFVAVGIRKSGAAVARLNGYSSNPAGLSLPDLPSNFSLYAGRSATLALGSARTAELLLFPSALGPTQAEVMERNQGAYFGIQVA